VSENEELDPEIAELLGVNREEGQKFSLNLEQQQTEGKLIRKTDLRPINIRKVYADKHMYQKIIGEAGEHGQRVHELITNFSKAVEKDEKSMYREKLIPAYWNMLSALIDTYFENLTDEKLALGWTILDSLDPLEREAIAVIDLTEYENAKLIEIGMIKALQRAYKEGIRFGVGTDASVPYVPHYEVWKEVKYLMKYAGMSAQEAIYFATKNNAEIIGVDNITGSIEIGKSADLQVVPGNPLDNIDYLGQVIKVIIRGHLIKNPKVKKIKKLKEIEPIEL